MRTSTTGLKPGARVHVKGQGKRARGTVSQILSDSLLRYRDDWGGGEHLVPARKVKKL